MQCKLHCGLISCSQTSTSCTNLSSSASNRPKAYMMLQSVVLNYIVPKDCKLVMLLQRHSVHDQLCMTCAATHDFSLHDAAVGQADLYLVTALPTCS